MFLMYGVTQVRRPWARFPACLSESASFLQDELALESEATRGELERANNAGKAVAEKQLELDSAIESLEETDAQLGPARQRIKVSFAQSHPLGMASPVSSLSTFRPLPNPTTPLIPPQAPALSCLPTL